jgi:hypothetical protein
MTEVYLERNVPGYIIGTRLFFKSHNTVLMGVDGEKAILRAAPGLERAMLVVDGANYYTIAELALDGNRDNRTAKSLCFNPIPGGYAGFHGSNLITEGEGYTVHHVDTTNAMCGSGFEAKGDDYEIYSVYSADNGDEAPSGPWADGITIVRCTSGSVHDNISADNTDIGIVKFSGTDCVVSDNEV